MAPVLMAARLMDGAKRGGLSFPVDDGIVVVEK